MLNCNTNVRSPYSSGTASSIDELVREARCCDLAVLGINDDVTIDGFKEFATACHTHRVYPLYNITLPVQCNFEHHSGSNDYHIAIDHSCRIIGKALRFPPLLNSDSRNLLASLWKASQDRIWKRIDTVNRILDEQRLSYRLDYSSIRSHYAKTALYDQHIILALYDHFSADSRHPSERLERLNTIFGLEGLDESTEKRDLILHRLLRQFLDNRVFSYASHTSERTVPLPQAKQIVLQAGGIPCFHCSFNAHDEWMKESTGPELLVRLLSAKGIHVVEIFPGETTIDLLRTFVHHLHQHNFCITMGSGNVHWPSKQLGLVCKDGTTLDDELLAMSYEGACVLAAHQDMHRQNRRGFVDESGKRLIAPDRMKAFVDMGDEVIRAAIN